MTSNYIPYKNILIYDGSSNINDGLSPTDRDKCLKKCNSDINCKGVGLLTYDSTNLNDQPYKIQKLKCNFVNNIDNTNYKDINNQGIFYSKSDFHALNLHANTQYQFTISNRDVNIILKQINGFYQLYGDKDLALDPNSNNKNTFYYDPINYNIILDNNGIATNYCLESTSFGIILSEINTFNNNQKFVYESIMSTIRPLTNLSQCLTLDTANNNKIILQDVESNSDNQPTTTTNTNTNNSIITVKNVIIKPTEYFTNNTINESLPDINYITIDRSDPELMWNCAVIVCVIIILLIFWYINYYPLPNNTIQFENITSSVNPSSILTSLNKSI